jgi:hypothetical protein
VTRRKYDNAAARTTTEARLLPTHIREIQTEHETMAAHVTHSARPDDPLHRAGAAVWHAVRVGASAVARFTVAVARWCWGTDEDQVPRLTRAERKRLRKEKVREALARKQAA